MEEIKIVEYEERVNLGVLFGALLTIIGIMGLFIVVMLVFGDVYDYAPFEKGVSPLREATPENLEATSRTAGFWWLFLIIGAIGFFLWARSGCDMYNLNQINRKIVLTDEQMEKIRGKKCTTRKRRRG